jgi:hypothetical protein
MDELLQKIGDHLKFYGYEIQIQDQILKANHTTKLDLTAWISNEGVLFRAPIAINAAAKEDLAGFHKFLNVANLLSVVARYVLEDEIMAIEAWFPRYYDQKPFAAFFDQFLADIRYSAQKERDSVQKYFSE